MFRLNIKDNRVFLKAPYLPDLIAELKQRIPANERSFMSAKKEWVIENAGKNVGIVTDLMNKYLGSLEERLVIFVCKEIPKVGGLPVLELKENGRLIPTKSEMFKVLRYFRVSPMDRDFEGFILMRAYVNETLYGKWKNDEKVRAVYLPPRKDETTVLKTLSKISGEFRSKYTRWKVRDAYWKVIEAFGSDVSIVPTSELKNVEVKVREILAEAGNKRVDMAELRKLVDAYFSKYMQ